MTSVAVFSLWCLAVLFQIACFYFDFYQNHMAFQPQTSSFTFERDFNGRNSNPIICIYKVRFIWSIMFDVTVTFAITFTCICLGRELILYMYNIYTYFAFRSAYLNGVKQAECKKHFTRHSICTFIDETITKNKVVFGLVCLVLTL